MALEPLTPTAASGEQIQLTQQRDSVWRALQDAREQVAAFELLARGANAQQNQQADEARAKALVDERDLSDELTYIEGKLADLNATTAQNSALDAGAPAQERSTTDIRRSGPAGQLAGRAAASETSRPAGAGATSGSVQAQQSTVQPSGGTASRQAPGRAANPQIKAATQRLKSAQGAYQRSSKKREDERVSIMKTIKKTGLLVVGFALFLAGVSDILSFFDLGWIVSWTIPIVSWFMVRRINSIMKSPERIANATNLLRRESIVLRQRVVPLLPPVERAKFLATERIGKLSGAASSYVSTWVRDSVITQLIELIPVVDILPLYLGQVIKMIINQNIEYQKVRKLTPAYERAIQVVDGLERQEIRQLERRLVALTGQQNVEPAQLSEAPGEPVTDIARPRSGVAPTVRPVQQRPVPIAAVPMRDVAAAA